MNHPETSEAVLGALRQRVHDDPALQAQLFALEDPVDFVAAVQRLASSIGYPLDQDVIVQAMDAGGRAWFERSLP